jgi:hypothetical protein
MLQTGLYYPFVHLRDDSWVKAAALYWRSLARAVPDGFPVRDRAVVRELNHDSTFIVDTDPRPAAEVIAPAFITAVQDNAQALRSRFAVRGRPLAQVRPQLASHSQGLAGIYADEVPHDLHAALEEAGLATRDWRRERGAWLAVDPALAWAYKCALTRELARTTAFAPVTDQLDAHTATGQWTADRIADTLLRPAEPPVGRETAQATLAMMAVRCVLPADLRSVPTAKIVRLRTEYADEFTAFTAAVAAATADVVAATEEVTDRRAFAHHLQGTFDQHIAHPLQALRKAIEGLKLETVTTTLAIKPEVTATGAGLGWLIGGTATAVGAGIAFAALATRQVAARERDTLVSSSPAGYLLRVEKELQPTTVLRRAGRLAARTAGVGI